MNKAVDVSSRKRLIFTFGAQIYNQLVTVAVQVALVPMLLHFWGAEQYGVWLLLSTLPTYLIFADFGFTLSAKNELATSVVRGDRPAAISVYQSTFTLLNFVIVIVIALSVALSAINLTGLFSLGALDGHTAKWVLLLLSGNVLLNQYLLLFAAGLRAIGRPAEEAMWNASARLAEGAVTALAASQSKDILIAALLILLSRSVMALLVWARLASVASWLRLGFDQANWGEIRRLAAPSFAFLAQSFAQVLMIQGPVVLLGHMSNPHSIATFSTCRTLVRLGTTGANLVNATLLPEYTRLYSTDKSLMRVTLRWHVLVVVLMVASYILALLLLGEKILHVWTNNVIHAGYPWFLLMVLAAGTEMAWTALLMPMAALNRHILTSYVYIVVSLFSLAALAPVLKTMGLDAVGASLLFTHCVMTAVAVFEFKKQLGGELKLT